MSERGVASAVLTFYRTKKPKARKKPDKPTPPQPASRALTKDATARE